MSLFKRTQLNIYLPTEQFFTAVFIVATIGGLAFLCLSIFPADGSAREISADEYCMHQLQDLSKAILAYKAEHGELQQSVVGPNGHQQSWRMLLMDGLTLSGESQYRPDEAWDSPGNLEAIENMRATKHYHCRVAKWDAENPFTSYVMLVRPGENWQAELPAKAVLIVEAQWSGIQLAEPRDLDIETVLSARKPFGATRLYSAHDGFVRAICMDGSIIEISTDLSKEELRDVLDGR